GAAPAGRPAGYGSAATGPPHRKRRRRGGLRLARPRHAVTKTPQVLPPPGGGRTIRVLPPRLPTSRPMPTRFELANAIRALAMDAVQKANSGHPGMPMGMADMAEVLWNDFLNHNPADPSWFNRDRFVVSNG